MIAMNLAQVADAIGLPVEAGWADVCVRSVEFDTRRITPGALFVALHGEHIDGHAFAGAAAEAGAVAVLGSAPIDGGPPAAAGRGRPGQHRGAGRARRRWPGRRSPHWSREHGLEVIGVTGSSGKTSTKDLIAAVLSSAVDDPGQVIAPPESFNNELGHPYTALRATPDTRFLVLELSARGIGHIAHAGQGGTAADRCRAQRRIGAHRRVRLRRGHRHREIRTGAVTSVRGRRRGGDPERRRPAGAADGRGDQRAGGAGRHQPGRDRQGRGCRPG